ncbi:hypothetical protein G1H11_16405 [Phytoactinopolyspora alkaliphila]|uniref:Uncharacterized protein n=1 Tax=Phytoactinopolyspora alkaliphila TaxID=1783498 RepID=A0A6N9YPY4_9ACTN|nr:DUF6506 family protein [Phytoactinopolyspora alkaliphila]NED96889.1 hypothetical protein [Phytoactinopolyspora alkaliphila]
MSISWAYIYEHPGTDPVADRTVVEREGLRTLLVPVPDPAVAPDVAVELIDEGVGLIELCGGFSIVAAAKVAEAVQGRVPIGHVTFAVDSVPAAAVYAAAFEES